MIDLPTFGTERGEEPASELARGPATPTRAKGYCGLRPAKGYCGLRPAKGYCGLRPAKG